MTDIGARSCHGSAQFVGKFTTVMSGVAQKWRFSEVYKKWCLTDDKSGHSNYWQILVDRPD